MHFRPVLTIHLVNGCGAPLQLSVSSQFHLKRQQLFLNIRSICGESKKPNTLQSKHNVIFGIEPRTFALQSKCCTNWPIELLLSIRILISRSKWRIKKTKKCAASPVSTQAHRAEKPHAERPKGKHPLHATQMPPALLLAANYHRLSRTLHGHSICRLSVGRRSPVASCSVTRTGGCHPMLRHGWGQGGNKFQLIIKKQT